LFNLVPNVDIDEIWEWKTDVIITHNGTEQRLSLRPRPYVTITAEFGPLTQAQRRTAFEVVQNAIKIPTNIALWQYSTPITQQTLIGNNRIYFNVEKVPVAVGGIVVVTNYRTGDVFSDTVTTIHADGATLTNNVTIDVETTFLLSLGMSAIIDKSNFTINQITAEFDLAFKSFIDPAVERPGTAASLSTFDGLTLLERKFLNESEETLEYDAETIDFGGVRQYESRHPYADYTGTRRFIFDRVLSNTDSDYWRKFLNTVKGAWKPFLLSTQMQDLTPFTTFTQNTSSITVNEVVLEGLDNAFSRIEIIYNDGTTSRHEFTSRTDNGNGSTTLSISPNLPNDPKVGSIQRISYLLKCRMGDTVRMSHGHLRSEISFEIRTTDQG